LITVLLPWYLDPGFKDIFQDLGFRVLWSASAEGLARCLDRCRPDIALEWQHGVGDFPVRDLLASRGLDTPVFLCLNWSGRLPGNPSELGYAGWLSVPFRVAPMLRVFALVLPQKDLGAVWKILEEVDARSG
jgi:hypothetical protein